MGKPKQAIWIGLSVVALAVAALLMRATLGDDSGIPSTFAFVCVATGEVFEMSIAEAATIPAKNPRTGTRTLVFCERGDDGSYSVAESDRWLIEEQLKEANRFVDLATLKVVSR